MLRELLQAREVKFPRRIWQEEEESGRALCMFWDGSVQAYATVIYARQETKQGGRCRIVAAKARVTPLVGMSIPRSELNALVLGMRLLATVTKAIGCSNKPQQVYIMGDSRSVILAQRKMGSAMLPYFQNRVAEIQENLKAIKKNLGDEVKISPFLHIPGELNPADLATRQTAQVADFSEESSWMTGPEFLKSLRSEWPATSPGVKETCDLDIPEEMRGNKWVTMSALSVKTNIPAGILQTVIMNKGLSYTNLLYTALNILARIMRRFKERPSKDDLEGDCSICLKIVPNILHHLNLHVVMRSPISHLERKEAERRMLILAMINTRAALRKGRLASLLPRDSEGLVTTAGRLVEQTMKRILGKGSLPILMPESQAARLYMWRAHVGADGHTHRAVQGTVARSREYAWVVQAGVLARKVVNACNACKIARRKAQTQQMAELPKEVTLPLPWITRDPSR